MSPVDHPQYRDGVIYTVAIVSATLACMCAALASTGWIRDIFVIAAPITILAGALISATRAYRSWKNGGAWQIWQGVMWFLLVFFVVTLGATYETVAT